MNFYPHHIGDYMTATVHLSWLEDCAYRRLLDVYYSREQSLPDVAQACRLVRATAKDERKAVETVLNEFFTLSAGSWTHPRCEAEIEKAKAAAERAKQNGARGGRPPKQEPKVNPEITQPVSVGNPEKSNSQAPITNPITNPKPKEKKSAIAPHLTEIPEMLLADFLAVRKAKKGGEFTVTALAGIQREADKAGLTLVQAITACCEYSWVGFNADWYAERQGNKAATEPAWRTDARKRMQEAVPSIAEGRKQSPTDFFEVEAKNVTPLALG